MSSTFAILFWALSSVAVPSSGVQCTGFANSPGKYCVHPPDNNTTDIIYFLHGGGGDESSWGEEFYFPAQIRKRWTELGLSQPTVVAISFGPTWLLAESNSSPESGLLEILVNKAIPEIEASLPAMQRRMVIGLSMGGFNALQLALKTPLFHRAVALCAPTSPISPFAPQAEHDEYMQKTGAWEVAKVTGETDKVSRAVGNIIALAKAFYPTPADWQKADPWSLLSAADKNTEIYLSSGYKDHFAIYEGNEAFASAATAAGFKMHWRPQWGGHCAIDIDSVARFLVE